MTDKWMYRILGTLFVLIILSFGLVDWSPIPMFVLVGIDFMFYFGYVFPKLYKEGSNREINDIKFAMEYIKDKRNAK